MKKKRGKLQSKIMTTMNFSFYIMIAVVFIVFFGVLNSLLHNNLETELLLKAQANADHINQTITKYMTDIEGFIFDIENNTDMSIETVNKAIDTKLSTFPINDVSAFYVGYGESNYLYDALGWTPNAEYIVKDRPWYSNALNSTGLNIITYADAATGIYAVCLSSKINSSTGENAVLAIDLIISTAFESNKMTGDFEYFFVEDSEGKIIYHPNKEFMPHDGKTTLLPDALKSYKSLDTLSEKSITNIKDYDGKEYSFTVNEVKNGGFRIYTGIQTQVVNKSIAQIFIIGIVLVMILVTVFSVFSYTYLNITIAKPINFITRYLSDTANTGNLGIVEERNDECEVFAKRNDEIGEMVKASNSLFELMKSQAQTLKTIAEKDLDQYITLRSNKSTVDLVAADLLDKLNEVMSEIQNSSTQVSSGSRQIADGAQALARGSSEQTVAVEELSNTISNVAGQTKHNAMMANKAADLATTIKINAEKGSVQMEQMMQAVSEISEASKNISNVIKVIDDIAFQTNILALNAAVEAARAGAHGKGFAVVAEEVRNLAAKSAEAAKDTGSMIANSIEKSSLGAMIAQETSGSLSDIVSGINESAAIVGDIAKYSDEQADAINRINDGISQVANIIQQNSAMSQESAAAAQEMSTQALVLQEVTAQFKIRGEQQNPISYINKRETSVKRKNIEIDMKDKY